MERLWAYLTIQQLLESDARKDTSSSPEKQRALELALMVRNNHNKNNHCVTEREKFYYGPGPEPGPLAFRATALTN